MDCVMKATRRALPIFIAFTVFAFLSGEMRLARRNACIGYLKDLENGKAVWAAENHKTTNDIPTMADIQKYIGKIPRCPSGGTYTLGTLTQTATCSINGHAIP